MVGLGKRKLNLLKMIKYVQLLPGIVALCSLLVSSCVNEEVEETIHTPQNKTDMPEQVLRHVVIFKFKDDAPAEAVEKINMAFNALPEAIPAIKDFEWGLNDSPENFHQDFTHCYMLTFHSENDRDSVYTPHPQHQAFVKSLQPHLEKVFVVDYWTK